MKTMVTDKDLQIIRQSQIKLCLEYFSHCGICPTLADVMSVTTMLEQFIKDGYSKDLKTKFESIDKYIEDTYKQDKTTK